MICPVPTCPGTVRLVYTERHGESAACDRCHCPISIAHLLVVIDRLRSLVDAWRPVVRAAWAAKAAWASEASEAWAAWAAWAAADRVLADALDALTDEQKEEAR
jgi:hypothetical protein